MNSCTDILVEDPQDQIFVDNYFETENDAISAVNSIYAILNSTSTPPTFGGVYHSSYWVASGLASDEMENRFVGVLEYDQLENFTHNPVNGTLYDLWQNCYKGINNANFAINGIPDVSMNEARKASLLGEARFLRGLLYFELVRLFGEVPLFIDTEPPLFPSKASVSEVYEQIKADLTFASENTFAEHDRGDGLGRATSGAAKSLLAKVHLTIGEYAACIALCDEVLDSGQYELWEDFADAFRIANENGKESIFNIGFGDANGSISFWEVGQFNVRLLPAQLKEQITGVNAQGWQVATQDLFDSYDPNDRRREVTLMDKVFALDGRVLSIEPHIRKYWDQESEPNGGNTENDFPYLRLSDIYLMKAEAINELNNGPNAEAYDAINTIRKRARFNGEITLDVLPDLEGLSYDSFKTALLNERRWEFTGEGKRWFDLVRFNKLEETVKAAKPEAQVSDFHKLFPIPQEELDLNKNLLPQNTGY
ncbi:membrane protein [Portibacter lacus]|uniref:Membrane protein n=2 Tax=Portibacter lacus TaxID=1099794 RepID=A0AA37SSK1_9BACT|nr:membrane protein [Portibacter lacus]